MKTASVQEFKGLLSELKSTKAWADMGFLNADLARMLGVSERTLYRYLAGETPIPLTIILLLRFMLKKQKGNVDELA